MSTISVPYFLQIDEYAFPELLTMGRTYASKLGSEEAVEMMLWMSEASVMIAGSADKR
jgi:hypothetical protein